MIMDAEFNNNVQRMTPRDRILLRRYILFLLFLRRVPFYPLHDLIRYIGDTIFYKL